MLFAPNNHFGGKQMVIFFGVFYDPNDPIATHMNDKTDAKFKNQRIKLPLAQNKNQNPKNDI